MNNNQEIIYILTNPSFPDWIKIGRCSDLKSRVSSLSNNTAVPLPFQIFYACIVPNAREVEANLFEIFDRDRVSPKREFFSSDPEQVVKVLQLVKIKDYQQETVIDPAEEAAFFRAVEKDARFGFAEAGVPLGSKIYLTRNPEIEATVVDQHTVLFDNTKWDFSELTQHLLKSRFNKPNRAVSAPRFWSYEGEMLVILKNKKMNIN